jgi:hypothetical protein
LPIFGDCGPCGKKLPVSEWFFTLNSMQVVRQKLAKGEFALTLAYCRLDGLVGSCPANSRESSGRTGQCRLGGCICDGLFLPRRSHSSVEEVWDRLWSSPEGLAQETNRRGRPVALSAVLSGESRAAFDLIDRRATTPSRGRASSISKAEVNTPTAHLFHLRRTAEGPC